MDSKEYNIVKRTLYGIFTSSYLRKYSYAVITVIILFILLAATICFKRRFGQQSISALSYKEFRSATRNFLPDVHQTTAPEFSHTLPLSETDPLLNDAFPHLINCCKHYSTYQKSGGCGLENVENSCYINSAVQCLCHIRPFVKIILNLQEQFTCPLPPIISVYHRLLTKMQSISEGSTIAHEIKVRIGELNRRFAGTDKQDSHEFLIVLIEALHDELVDNCQNSSIGELMHGIIRSTVKCLECEQEIETDDLFISLSLPIHESAVSNSRLEVIQNIIQEPMNLLDNDTQNGITLNNCFENLLRCEQLGANGQWFCQNCQKLTDAIKKLDLHRLPKVLILQLKRFTYDLTNDMKITTKILIPENLDLRKFLKENGTNQPWTYNLVAVLAHTGTLSSGHYTTFARHLNSYRWYHFDDQHVRQASLNEALASDAYVLVYERQN